MTTQGPSQGASPSPSQGPNRAPPPPPTSQPLGPPALQAPWRLQYLEALDAKEKASGAPAPSTGSFLRDYWLSPQNDTPNHVIVRSPHGLILLNAFPYANGHLLVALGDARPTLLDYTPDQRSALWKLTEVATDLLQRTLEPQGINTGINQGRAAGAGVPQHLHVHLVPRWNGDVNFISTVGQVRVIPSSLDAMAARFRKVWEAMNSNAPSTPSSPIKPAS
jgi:ATP adenylyltransferase